ncbi:MAG: helix-turn-helix domain-containing protein [Gammaproteobacteria bacterium]|nr:helix-turn-helix domain-containing protein [Gammaproteobacteria bacterium]
MQRTTENYRDCSVVETCTILNVTAPTVYKLIATGELDGYKVGRARRITGESIQRLRTGMRKRG